MKEGWVKKALKEVCEIKPPKKEARERLGEKDEVTFLPMNMLGIDQKYSEGTEKKKLQEVADSYTYFRENDVLLAKITPCFENGKLGIAKNLENGLGFGSSEFIVYRPSAEIDKEYLYYFFYQPSFRETGSKRMTGAVGHKRIPKDFYEDYLIPVPPIHQQKQIVQILDGAFAAIDQAKANIEKNIKNAKELFQSKLDEIFSQKGESWKEKTLEEVCSVLNGYAFKSKDVIEKSNTQLLRMGNLYQNQLDLNRKPAFYPDSYAVEYKNFVLKKGDLVMSLTGTVDKTDYGYTVSIPETDVDLLLNQRIMKIEISDESVLEKEYLRNFLLSPGFLKKLYSTASGTRQANLSSKTILGLSINFPSDIEEQKMFVQKTNQLREHLTELEKKYFEKLMGLEELKKSILEKAFSGELTHKEVEV